MTAAVRAMHEPVIETHEMPPEAANGFAVYKAGGGRSLAKTAEILNVPPGTVRSWAFRYGWNAALRDEDAELKGAAVKAAVVAASAQHLKNIEVAIAIRDDATARKSDRLKAIEWLSAIGGLVPSTKVEIEGTGNDDAKAGEYAVSELTALAEAGNVTALVAIAQGRKPRAADA